MLPSSSEWFTRNKTERQGFEPWVPCGTTVFETATIDHSGTSPREAISNELFSVHKIPEIYYKSRHFTESRHHPPLIADKTRSMKNEKQEENVFPPPCLYSPSFPRRRPGPPALLVPRPLILPTKRCRNKPGQKTCQNVILSNGDDYLFFTVLRKANYLKE